jgi:DNA polymerase-3 subunit alpha
MTDHGNLFGAVKFFHAARKQGIKPIIGAEVYVARNSRFDRQGGEAGLGLHHMTLLARDLKGYRNLMALLTAAHLESFYYKPRVDRELLAAHADGLLALSGCSFKGEIPVAIMENRVKDAEKAAMGYREIFGPEFFYLEIQRTGVEGIEPINLGLVALSKKTGIPLVATNDCHYLNREDREVQDVLICIGTGKKLEDTDRLRFSSDEFYVKSSEEMARLFADLPEAYRNSREAAAKCNLTLDKAQPLLPSYPSPDGTTGQEFLSEIARLGLDRRSRAVSPAASAEQYRARLDYELGVIGKMGFADYFLTVWDYIRHAKEQGIPVGPGRGSAAGSLVAYAVGITDIDPLRYNLLFERFLNPERISLPDIDVDFCQDRRDEVISYIRNKYSDDRVASIVTFGTLQAKAAIRDVGRVMGLPYALVDKVAKLVPQEGLAEGMTLRRLLKDEPTFAELSAESPPLTKLVAIADKIVEIPRHASVHAAGVVIAPTALKEHVPLFRTKDGVVCTQYDMEDLDTPGLVKFDILGLRTLTLVDNAVRLINEKTEGGAGFSMELSPESLPLDDPETFKLLQEGKTTGVFQLENQGMKDLLIQMKPDRIEDLFAVLALYRPGPLGAGIVDDYVSRRRGKSPVTYPFPVLEGILKDTYGLPIYQEQVMQIAMTLASFSASEADELRKAMAKKKLEILEAKRGAFLAGAEKNGWPRDAVDSYFSTLLPFSEYGFNKSHSAAYAVITYATAYLKAHFPPEFMAALLTSQMTNTDKMVRMIQECRQMGIKVMPPEVNESDRNFTVTAEGIRFGLLAIKNVGSGAIDAILDARREGGRFTTLVEFCERIDPRRVNRRVLEGLIKSGAFDSFGKRRSQLMAVLDQAMEFGARSARDRSAGQMSIFQSLTLEDSPPPDLDYPDIPEWSELPLLTGEKETLGFYVSGNPLAPYEQAIARLTRTSTADSADWKEEQTVVLAGLLEQVEKRMTKRGEPMAKAILEDQYGQVEIVIFPKVFEKASLLFGTATPVLIEGKVDLRGNVISVRVDEIEDLAKAKRKRGREVHIRLRGPGLSSDDLEGLRDLIMENPGHLPVYLHLSLPELSQEVVVDTAAGLRVNPDGEFLTLVERRFGAGSVLVE